MTNNAFASKQNGVALKLKPQKPVNVPTKNPCEINYGNRTAPSIFYDLILMIGYQLRTMGRTYQPELTRSVKRRV